MRFFWRIFTTIAAVNAICLTVLFGLASVQYDAALSGLIKDRFAVTAQNLAEPFQAVANLGLPIDSLRNVDALLERTKRSADEITGIYLFDPSGVIVRSTEATAPQSVESAAIASVSGPKSTLWFSEEANAFLIASPIKTTNGDTAGGVLIEHSKLGKTMQVHALAAELAFMASAILLFSLGVGFFLLRLTLAEHVQVFDALLSTFDRFERQFWRGHRLNEAEPEPVRRFGIDTREFFSLLEQSEQQYQAAKESHAFPASGSEII